MESENEFMENNIIAFYHETDEYGCFSNWYPSPFEYCGIKYSSSEQYMMFQKVTMFSGYDLGEKILATDDPKRIKQLGRTHFKEFDSATWDKNSYTIVKRGVLAKFQQHKDIQEILLSTGSAILAEASPADCIWGVGTGIRKAVDVRTWRGRNLLGRALMEVRKDLKVIPDYIDARDEKSIDVWKWYPAELLKVPQYHNAIVPYLDSLKAPYWGPYSGRLVEAFTDCEFTFEDIEEMMRFNMGGGFPWDGFWEMKQEIYDIHRKLSLNHSDRKE